MENLIVALMTEEITPEERELIRKHREERARKAKIDLLAETLKDTIREIEKLGGRVDTGEWVGGKYVSMHCPRVKADKISVCYNR